MKHSALPTLALLAVLVVGACATQTDDATGIWDPDAAGGDASPDDDASDDDDAAKEAAVGDDAGDDVAPTEDVGEDSAHLDAAADDGAATPDLPAAMDGPAMDVTSDGLTRPDTIVGVDVTPPPDAAPTDPCASSPSCMDCATRLSCGWCGALSRCMTGASSGPTSGACGSGWAFTTTACGGGTMTMPDPCAAATDCGACAAMGSCGWCKTTHTCASGTAAGPTGGSCASADWAWLRSQCTALSTDGCRSSSSCEGCRFRSNCGWCDDSNTCHQGTSAGPTDRACSRGNWGWTSVLLCL